VTVPLIFHPIAEAEYTQASAHYDSERPGLGAEFELEVQAVLLKIQQQPDRYPVAIRDIRFATARRFPYSVYYRIRRNRIDVLSVFHESRNPSEWQSRS
jgi:plasmid stabilization system protein ParE